MFYTFTWHFIIGLSQLGVSRVRLGCTTSGSGFVDRLRKIDNGDLQIKPLTLFSR